MPTYLYEREDGTRFEIQQSIKDDALKECPETGQKVKKIINWEGQTIMYGWSAAKELNKKKNAEKPGVTTLPHYKKKIDANTEKAYEMEEKARKEAKGGNLTDV